LFVDPDHEGNKKTGRPRRGHLVYNKWRFDNGVLKEATNNRIISLRSSVFGFEEWDGVSQRIKIESTNDGSGYLRTNIHIWRQHVGHSQYAKALFDTEKEVKFHMLSHLS
jgi:hypothetical protein